MTSKIVSLDQEREHRAAEDRRAKSTAERQAIGDVLRFAGSILAHVFESIHMECPACGASGRAIHYQPSPAVASCVCGASWNEGLDGISVRRDFLL
jgi:hypothetical protein